MMLTVLEQHIAPAFHLCKQSKTKLLERTCNNRGFPMIIITWFVSFNIPHPTENDSAISLNRDFGFGGVMGAGSHTYIVSSMSQPHYASSVIWLRQTQQADNMKPNDKHWRLNTTYAFYGVVSL
jgi:hypothetical protein